MTSDCIDHGGREGHHYSTCYHQKRYIGKHVRALMVATGQQADGRMALHTCDNKRCINPAHLYWGTAADNVRDMVERGQHRHPFPAKAHTNYRSGADKPNARWTQAQVADMCSRWSGGQTQTAIAAHYGCRQSDIQRIVKGAAWRT